MAPFLFLVTACTVSLQGFRRPVVQMVLWPESVLTHMMQQGVQVGRPVPGAARGGGGGGGLVACNLISVTNSGIAGFTRMHEGSRLL